MNKMMILIAFAFSQFSMAAQLTSVARVDLTKTTAQPSTPFYVGTTLELKLTKTIEVKDVVWTGYSKEYICVGSTHSGVDGEVECDTNEVLTWVPNVKITGVKEILRAGLMTEAGYDEQVKSSSDGEYAIPRTCIQNFESYRYFGAQAPNGANTQLKISADCAIYIMDNSIVYYEAARALKGNYLSASIYRSGLLKLNLTQPLALSNGISVALPTQPVIVMNKQKAGEYPVLTLLGLTPDKQHNLFGDSYLYPQLNDKN